MDAVAYSQSNHSFDSGYYRDTPKYATMLGSTLAKGHRMPNSLSSTTVSTRRIGNRVIEVIREKEIDSALTSSTRHTTSVATLDLQGDPAHKRWYNRDNHHTFSGSDYSTVGARDRLHPSIYIQDGEEIDIETSTGWSRSREGGLHDDYHNYESWDEDYEYHRDHEEDMGYGHHDRTVIVEDVEAEYDLEGIIHDIELDVDTRLEHDRDDFEDYDEDYDTYAHHQRSQAHYDEEEAYEILQAARELVLDDGDATGLSARAGLHSHGEREFDVIVEGDAYDGDEFGDFDDRGLEYDHDDGHHYGDDDQDEGGLHYYHDDDDYDYSRWS